jgi:hypothetical protein
MKDQYVGDVNDFRKYGLLRLLTRDNHMALSVCWMLTPNDGRTDGKFIEYLDKPDKWRGFDPELFDALQPVVAGKTRNVQAIEEAGILHGARFFSSVIPDGAPGRDAWFKGYWSHAAGTDLVFFDPDNGLEVKSVKRGNKNSSKFLYWSEVKKTADQGHSVLVYQHFPRAKRDLFISDKASELGHRCGVAEIVAFRTANVLFLLAAKEPHWDALVEGAEDVGRRWEEQIEVSRHRSA